MPDPQQTYNPAEFAAQIKSKFPQYKDWPDDYLSQEFVKKFPQYSGWVNLDPANLQGAVKDASQMFSADAAQKQDEQKLAQQNYLTAINQQADQAAGGSMLDTAKGLVKGVQSGVEALPGGQRLGFRMPTAADWSPVRIQPNDIRPQEQTGALVGQMLGGGAANVLPYMNPAGGVIGPAMNAAYAAEQERNREFDQGRGPGDVSNAAILGQAALAGAAGHFIPDLAPGSSVYRRAVGGALRGAIPGAIVGAAGPLIQQLTDKGKVDLSDPGLLNSILLNAGIGATAHGAASAAFGPAARNMGNMIQEGAGAPQVPPQAPPETPPPAEPVQQQLPFGKPEPAAPPNLVQPSLPGMSDFPSGWGHTPLNMAKLDDAMTLLKKAFPEFEFQVPPGTTPGPDEIAGMRALAEGGEAPPSTPTKVPLTQAELKQIDDEVRRMYAQDAGRRGIANGGSKFLDLLKNLQRPEGFVGDRSPEKLASLGRAEQDLSYEVPAETDYQLTRAAGMAPVVDTAPAGAAPAIAPEANADLAAPQKPFWQRVLDNEFKDNSWADVLKRLLENKGAVGEGPEEPSRAAPTFYSRLRQAVENAKFDKTTPQAAMNLIRRGGPFNEEEAQWTELPNWLASQKGQVTKQAILDYLDQHKIEIDESLRGPDGKETRYDKYTTPGGENYRELLLKLKRQPYPMPRDLPPNEARLQAMQEYFRLFGTVEQDFDNPEVYRVREPLTGNMSEPMPQQQALDAWKKMLAGHDLDPDTADWIFGVYVTGGRSLFNNSLGLIGKENYMSPHWDDKDVLSHVRFKDFSTPDGAKALHLDEIQSDWHQDARDRGYAPRTSPDTSAVPSNMEMDSNREGIRGLIERMSNHKVGAGNFFAPDIYEKLGFYDSEREPNITPEEVDAAFRQQGIQADPADLAALAERMNRHLMYQPRGRLDNYLSNRGLPDAPFKPGGMDWSALSMKRMIRWAAEHGYDRLTWTTGDQQADRYNMGEALNNLQWSWLKNGDTPVVRLRMNVQGQPREIVVDSTPQLLHQWVGNDLQDHIVRHEGQGGSLNHSELREVSASGRNGMREFYDRRLVNWANKYAKQWGTRVRRGQIIQGFEPKRPSSISQPLWDVFINGGERRAGIWLQDHGVQHPGPIIQNMKDAVMGEPPFHIDLELWRIFHNKGERAARDWLEDNAISNPNTAIQRMKDAVELRNKGTHSADAWELPITPAMRQSAMYKGQPLGIGATEILGKMAGTLGGAAIGAQQDKEDRLRGALLGGAAGLTAAHLLSKSPQVYTAMQGLGARMKDAFGAMNTTAYGPQGRQAKSILIAEDAKGARRVALLGRDLEQVRAAADGLSPSDQLRFIDTYEDPGRGIGALPPALQPVGKAIQQTFKGLYDEIRARGGLQAVKDFDEHWFGRKWKNAGQPAPSAQPMIEGLGSMSGSAARGRGYGFTRPRSFMTMADGVRAGLTPETTNPIDMAMLKVQEMNRWIVEHDARKVLENEGQLVRVPTNSPQREPNGWVRDFADPSGQTFVSPGAAKTLEYYRSAGLSGNPIMGAIKSTAQRFVMARLALSGFHGVTTAVHAMGVKAGSAAKELVNAGDPVEAVAKALESPFAAIGYWRKGRAFLRDQYFNPNAPMTRELGDYLTSGARGGIDPFYTTRAPQAFKREMNAAGGGVGGAIDATLSNPGTAAAAALEVPTNALMDKVVQPIKTGIQLERNAQNRAYLQKQNIVSPRTVRNALQEGGRATDQQMGMMVYNNLNMPRGIKDALMMGTTAPGWNIGTAATFAGAPKDIAGALSGSRAKAGLPPLSDRAAFAAAGLPLSVAAMNALYQWAHTGKGPGEAKDLLFPQTGQTNPEGNPERVVLPNYLSRDAASFYHSPMATLAGKVNPWAQEFTQLAQNKDWRGTQIYDPNASWGDIGEQLKNYAINQNQPISVQQIRGQGGRRRVGSDLETKAEETMGVQEAPSWLTRDPGIQKAMELQAAHFPQTRSLEEQAHIDTRREGREAVRNQDVGKIGDMLQAGTLRPQDVLTFAKSIPTEGRLIALTRGLSPSEMLQLYAKASPTERVALRPKLAMLLPKADPATRAKIADLLR